LKLNPTRPLRRHPPLKKDLKKGRDETAYEARFAYPSRRARKGRVRPKAAGGACGKRRSQHDAHERSWKLFRWGSPVSGRPSSHR